MEQKTVLSVVTVHVYVNDIVEAVAAPGRRPTRTFRWGKRLMD